MVRSLADRTFQLRFESAQSERSGELEALATAKKILKEKTGGAAKRAYDLLEEESPALVQVSVRDTRRDQVVGLLQELSKTVQARGLSELAVKVLVERFDIECYSDFSAK